MKPTKTRGICGSCRESNPYTEVNCLRCGARLAWAFLIDGKKDTDFDTPLENFFDRLFDRNKAPIEHKIFCRYCDKPIKVDEKVCRHCGNWLTHAQSWSGSGGWPGWTTRGLIDPEAPEIQRLLKLNKEQNPKQ